jgi:hypothetical protein
MLLPTLQLVLLSQWTGASFNLYLSTQVTAPGPHRLAKLQGDPPGGPPSRDLSGTHGPAKKSKNQSQNP